MPKRRRKDSFGQTPKRQKYNGQAPVANHPLTGQQRTGKRRRPRTKQLRQTLVDIIEASLASRGKTGQAVREQIHYDPQYDERPYIYLPEFLSTSEEVTEDMRIEISKISKEGLLKMNNLTTIFELEEDPRTGQLMVFCAPTVPADECTIYITNIPRNTEHHSLSKLLIKFGKVADMTFPLKKPRIPLSRPKNKQTAMVQFTEDYPAQEMLKKYASNRRHPQGPQKEGDDPFPRKPKPHKRRWRKIVWRDAMILKRRYDRISGEKEGISNGKVNGTGQKSTEEHRRRSGSSLRRNKSVVRKRSRAGKDMFNIDWPALRKRLKERRKKRNHRKKKRLQQRKAKRARVKAAGTTLPRRIRFRRRRRLRARARGAGSVDSFFSAIQVYSESEYYTLQTDYRRLQQSRLAERVEEYKSITDDGAIDLVKEKKQQEFIEEYVDQRFGAPANVKTRSP